jgi:serine/threonine protein kinase/TolB-like protein
VTGRTIAHYRVLEKLGGGGMGVVYKAEDVNLRRCVALKFLPESLMHDPIALERFEREARAASLLNHPNICSIYEIEEDEGKPVLVMELLEGEDLKQRLLRGALATEELLHIGSQICGALQAAHEQGIIHRDIKPANIYLAKDGRARLLDFGLAKLQTDLLSSAVVPIDAQEEQDEEADSDSQLTRQNVIPGTAAYMSPEQIRSELLDSRSDVFSLGSVLYEMATGRRPFQGKNMTQLMGAILHGKPRSPLDFREDLPDGIEPVLGKAMENDREMRYENAAQLRTDLDLLKRESGSALEPLKSGAAAKYRRTFRRGSVHHNYLQLAVAVVLAAVLLGITAWWARRLHTLSAPASGNKSVVVLPLQELSPNGGNTTLRIELADEIADRLVNAPGIEVRPLADPMRYAVLGSDPQQAAREVHAEQVVTGHLVRDGDNLVITLIAIDAGSNRVRWQKSVSVNPRQNGTKMTEALVPELMEAVRK